MISIARYISEGFLKDLDQKFQQTSLAKTMDKANKHIDNTLSQSEIGRSYMRAEKRTGNFVNQGGKAFANLYDKLRGRNYKIRK